jgi:RNA-directed DNA polymerase
MVEPNAGGRSFDIDKWLVKRAWEQVRDNYGAAGVDGQTIGAFEANLENNLYKVWNRMSSGTYFPPPVLAVEIPKTGGGVRVLGVPTVADRVAQTVVKNVLEPLVEPGFHPDSYGYRPSRSALDAVAACRQRCFEWNWVVDLDIKGFFDSVPHEQILRAVDHHTELRWVRLYVRRWLVAPLRAQGGAVVSRDRGTPQGSVISPLLANVFMHYAFDMWMARKCPTVPFERYCDDVIVHCESERQAVLMRSMIAERLGSLGLELHPHKTKIVYCKDSNRSGSYENTSFTFLGYDFRARCAKGRGGGRFTGFLPAVSKQAKKAMSAMMRSWRLGRQSTSDFPTVRRRINPVVSGWINYYGRFYPSELVRFLQRINAVLVRWLRGKYKRLHRSNRRARALLRNVYEAYRGMFAHWRFGAIPPSVTMGAV